MSFYGCYSIPRASCFSSTKLRPAACVFVALTQSRGSAVGQVRPVLGDQGTCPNLDSHMAENGNRTLWTTVCIMSFGCLLRHYSNLCVRSRARF